MTLRFSQEAMYEQEESDDLRFGSEDDVKRCRGRHEKAAQLAAKFIDAGLVRSNGGREHRLVLKLLERAARAAIKTHPDAGERRAARGLLRLIDIVRGGYVADEVEVAEDPLRRQLLEIADDSFARSPLEALAAVALLFGMALNGHPVATTDGSCVATYVRAFGTALCAVAGARALEELVRELEQLEAAS